MNVYINNGSYRLRVADSNGLFIDERSISIALKSGERIYGNQALHILTTRKEHSCSAQIDTKKIVCKFSNAEKSTHLYRNLVQKKFDETEFNATILYDQHSKDIRQTFNKLSQLEMKEFVLVQSPSAVLSTKGLTSGCTIDFHDNCALISPCINGSVLKWSVRTEKTFGFDRFLNDISDTVFYSSTIDYPDYFKYLLSDLILKTVISVPDISPCSRYASAISQINTLITQTNVRMPNGKLLHLSQDHQQIFEPLFDQNGLINLFKESQATLGIYERSYSQKNVVFTGDFTKLRGLGCRLNFQIRSELPKSEIAIENGNELILTHGAALMEKCIRCQKPKCVMNKAKIEELGIDRAIILAQDV